jgi:hypothetical protein
MKTGSITKSRKFTSGISVSITILFALIFFSSCERYGTDGYPGRAYLSVNWDVSKPDYLDVGTSDIPSVFEWGTYYRAYPGLYTLDYDGQVWKGTYWAKYAWLVDYQIYENPGQQGGANYNGRDGLNSYFDIVCTPYGPEISSYDAKIKPEGNNDVNSMPQTITITKKSGNFSIKITYKKVLPPQNPNKPKEAINTPTNLSK